MKFIPHGETNTRENHQSHLPDHCIFLYPVYIRNNYLAVAVSSPSYHKLLCIFGPIHFSDCYIVQSVSKEIETETMFAIEEPKCSLTGRLVSNNINGKIRELPKPTKTRCSSWFQDNAMYPVMQVRGMSPYTMVMV